MSQFFYAGPNRQPVESSQVELPELLRHGIINPKTLVWAQGWPNWRPVEEAFPHLTAPVPPPAPAPALAPAAPAIPLAAAPAAAYGSAALATTGTLSPPNAAQGAKRCHVVDYEILGNDMQIVEVELDPNEIVVAEAGAMNYMDSDIHFETKMGDGSNPNPGLWDRLKQVGKRMFTGESLFMTHFTNRGSGKKRVAFAAPYPGKIVPVDLSTLGGTLLCQKDAFLCAAYGTKVGIAFNQKIGVGLFGGEGFILQKLEGDGMAFIHAGGMVVKRELRGEKILVDTGCLVAFTVGVEYNIQRAGNLKSMIFGGEGLFLATLQGFGTVWLQSLPLSKLADRILANAGGGRSDDSGSLLGGLGNLFEGH